MSVREPAFAESRIDSPVFDKAAECTDWLAVHRDGSDRHGSFGTRLVLASWNTQKSLGANWEQELQDLSEGLDILLLQEAAIVPAAQNVILYPFISVAEGYHSMRGPTGLLSASSVQPLASCTFLDREPLLRSVKASNIIVYPLLHGEETLMVVNVHSINFSLGLGAYRRQIDRLAKVLSAHDGPIIFAGDFNIWNVRRKNYVQEVVNSLGLRQVQFATDSRKKVFGYPLDRIYFRGMPLIEATTKRISSSDHDPLIAVWDFKSR